MNGIDSNIVIEMFILYVTICTDLVKKLRTCDKVGIFHKLQCILYSSHLLDTLAFLTRADVTGGLHYIRDLVH